MRDLLEKFNMAGAKPNSTPLCSSTPLKLHDGYTAVNSQSFRSMIGALQYVTLTRPDLAFAINKLSQFMHKPSQMHLQQLKRTLSDVDQGGNLDDRTSTSAYVIFLGGNPVSWMSKRQRTVARSSTEAEYRLVASTIAEVMWLSNLLQELGISSSVPHLYCDNIGATYLCSNLVFHSRMKHIALDYHFVRQLVQQG
ncbi:hypothetical protein L6164_031520 [Bauhinia variegata]|uniref:Uncharacterized protein n=1 Tax=Bauhinia variegata TaxID=167791 RepID=A0ACB9LH87_BAUVA|nr:hypothetical protein L6164_031520 [Bauhinia variegata]